MIISNNSETFYYHADFMAQFHYFTDADAKQLIHPREGERKLGQVIQYPQAQLSIAANLQQAQQAGIKFVIVGLSDDVGPQANYGRAGATGAFTASMQQWLNLQANDFFDASCTMVLGELQQDIPSSSEIESLRRATTEFDQAVIPLVSEVFKQGMQLIAIGGGHNNAYGIIKALSETKHSGIAAINLDPHCDFRPLEGRHSGNGFSYAATEGYLKQYHVLGLHELKNSQASLEQLNQFDASWHTFQQIWVRQELTLNQACQQALPKLTKDDLPFGIELDVDAINNMPASAVTVAGVPLIDAARYIHFFAHHCQPNYLHVTEAAPSCHNVSSSIGIREVGQSISELIYAYIKPQLI